LNDFVAYLCTVSSDFSAFVSWKCSTQPRFPPIFFLTPKSPLIKIWWYIVHEWLINLFLVYLHGFGCKIWSCNKLVTRARNHRKYVMSSNKTVMKTEQCRLYTGKNHGQISGKKCVFFPKCFRNEYFLSKWEINFPILTKNTHFEKILGRMHIFFLEVFPWYFPVSVFYWEAPPQCTEETKKT